VLWNQSHVQLRNFLAGAGAASKCIHFSILNGKANGLELEMELQIMSLLKPELHQNDAAAQLCF
jgi:hypothetical protein